MATLFKLEQVVEFPLSALTYLQSSELCSADRREHSKQQATTVAQIPSISASEFALLPVQRFLPVAIVAHLDSLK